MGSGNVVGALNTGVNVVSGALQGAAANASVLCPAGNGFVGGMVNGAISSLGSNPLTRRTANFIGGALGNAVTEFSNSEDLVQKGENGISTKKILANSAILGGIQMCASGYMDKATQGIGLDVFGANGKINPTGALFSGFSFVPGYAWGTLTYAFTDNFLTRNFAAIDAQVIEEEICEG